MLFPLPSFAADIAGTSSGRINQETATVALTSPAKSVTVHLRHAPFKW
jgi:hypothetical protein